MPGPIARGMAEIGRAFGLLGPTVGPRAHIARTIEHERQVSTLRVLAGGEFEDYLGIADGNAEVAVQLASAGVTVADAAELKAAGYRGPDIYRIYRYTEPLRRMQAMEVTDNPAQRQTDADQTPRMQGGLVWSDVLTRIETATHVEGVDTGPVRPWRGRTA